MFDVVVDVAIGWVLGLMALAAVALVRPGETARRLVIADLAVVLLVSAFVLIAIRQQERYYLDAALALSLLSFVASIVIAIYAARGLDAR